MRGSRKGERRWPFISMHNSTRGTLCHKMCRWSLAPIWPALGWQKGTGQGSQTSMSRDDVVSNVGRRQERARAAGFMPCVQVARGPSLGLKPAWLFWCMCFPGKRLSSAQRLVLLARAKVSKGAYIWSHGTGRVAASKSGLGSLAKMSPLQVTDQRA